MPTKGNVRRITSKTPYEIIQKGCIKEKLRESEKSGRFRKRFSSKLRFALAFRSAVYCVTASACLAERSYATCHR